MPDDTRKRRGFWRAFRDWRRTRPFWGGLLLVVAAVEMLVAPAAQSLILPLNLVIYAGIAGISVYLISLLLIALGVLAWLQPQQRLFYGVVGSLLSVASFVTANFGGFVIGMLLGIVGGALVFSWEPARQRRSGRRRTGDTDGTGPDGDEAAAEPDRRRIDAPPPGPEEGKEQGGVPGEKEGLGKDGGPGGGESRGGTHRLHALAALPLAVLLVLPASAPAGITWPWDDWFGGDDGESAPAEPSPSPSPSASSPEPDPGGGSGEEDADEESGSGDGAEQEDGAEAGGGGALDPADPADCELRTGAESAADSEEEFLAAVEACEAAREAGASPEAPMAQGDEPFTASDAESGLTADTLTMYGARFGGVVEYPTTGGSERYLKIIMTEGKVTGGELWWMDGEARASLALPSMTLGGADGGDAVMHVQELTITILGIGITFTPDFPPPLLPSVIPVPEVDVSRPVADAAHLSVEGLDIRADS